MVRCALPLLTVEEVNQQALTRIVQVQGGTILAVAASKARADTAGDSAALTMFGEVPAFNLAPTPGSTVTYKVQVATSVATSDVTVFSGDFFGEFLRPSLTIESAKDGPDGPRCTVLRGYTATQDVLVYEGNVTQPVPVVCIHGGGVGESGAFQFQDPLHHRVPYRLAEAGFRVFEPALPTSPVAGFGNAASVTALTNLVSWITTNYTYPSGFKVGFVGLSAGMIEALNYGWRNTTRVAGMIGVIPGTNTDSLHIRNPFGTTTTDINNAYAGDWPSNRPARDPHLNAASIRPFGDKIRMYFSSDDFAALPGEVIEDARAWGAQALSFGSYSHFTHNLQVDDLVTFAANTFRNIP
jgi:hypothetical protein